MKIRTKLTMAFLGSLSISVLIFILLCYYGLHIGYFSGVSRTDMKQALIRGQILCTETDNYETTLQILEAEYIDMDFAVLQDGKWITDTKVPVLSNDVQIIQAMNGQHEICQEYEVVATAFQREVTSDYLICFVEKNKMEAMSYDFNMPRASGILGKFAVLGGLITVVIMGFAIHGLQREYEEKERYEKARKELISNISHDLRTPLSSVLGYSEMLKNGIYDDEEEQKQYVDIIYRKSVYMEKLLTELLEYSRLELGTIRIQKQRMDLTELVREILIEYYPILEKNQYELVLEIPEEPLFGNWDKEKLGRVFRNLIDNALKYGMDAKRLRIAVQKNEKQAYIEIQDFGVGISQKDITRVTERFYRADHARNSQKGGMGLGLFIVQEIIKLHGGTFQIDSKVNEGCKMMIQLPIVS